MQQQQQVPSLSMRGNRRRKLDLTGQQSRPRASYKRRKLSLAITLPIIIFTSLLMTFSSTRLTVGDHPSDTDCLNGRSVVATMTTTRGRIRDGKFLAALRSVIAQGYPSGCLDVWAFVPAEGGGDEGGIAAIDELVALLRPVTKKYSRRVFFFTLVNDPGPVSKFIYTVEALTWPHSKNQQGWRPESNLTLALNFGVGIEHPSDEDLANYMSFMQSKAPLIFVCDDDRYYQRALVASLVEWHSKLGGSNAVVGARGWRIRPDLEWGVVEKEKKWHVINGWDIAHPYQVGVLVGVNGYMVPSSALKNKNLSDFSKSPDEARLMDDIWMMGNLAAAGAPRWVIPLFSDALICGRERSELDHRVRGELDLDRGAANRAVLKHFANVWEPDLYYTFGGRRNQPHWRSWLFRIWITVRAQFETGLLRLGMI